MTILKSTDFMTEEDAKRFADLKAEYSKLSTSAKRMKEIQEEMKAIRFKAIGQ